MVFMDEIAGGTGQGGTDFSDAGEILQYLVAGIIRQFSQLVSITFCIRPEHGGTIAFNIQIIQDNNPGLILEPGMQGSKKPGNIPFRDMRPSE